MGVIDIISSFISIQTFLVGILAGLISYYIYTKARYRYPPGPWGMPLIGNWKIYTSSTMNRDVVKLSEQYGPVVSIFMGPMRVVFLNNLEVVIEALVKKKTDFASRPISSSLSAISEGGKDIAFAPYSANWKYQKKVAGKALRYYMRGTHLEDMVNDVCAEAFKKMGEEKEPFAPKEYISRLVTQMLYTMCFGRKCEFGDPEVEYILESALYITECFGKGLLEDIIPYITKVYTTHAWKELMRTNDDILEYIRKHLDQHRSTFDPNNVRDYLDSMILAREEAETEGKTEEVEMLSDVHVIQTISNILFAGIDTTRMTLDWFVCFMTAYQDFQEKCQEEIDKVVGDRTPSVTDRPNLCFTEACIMETMRVGSVVGLGIPHATTCDTTVGGYDIPKDTTIFINHWALHNDAKVWKNVDKFDPYRYLDSEGKMDKKPENWLPFSAGRRVCLGEPVARTELLLIAANLLQHFMFKSPAGFELVPTPHHENPGVEVPKDYKVLVQKRK